MNDPSKKRGVNLPPPSPVPPPPWKQGVQQPPPGMGGAPPFSEHGVILPTLAPVMKAPQEGKPSWLGQRIQKYRGATIAILLLLLLLGAAWKYWPSNTLAGKVSFQGETVTGGSVLLVGVDSRPQTAAIKEDGSYKFTNVPRGEAKLAVYNPSRRMRLGSLFQFFGGEIKVDGQDGNKGITLVISSGNAKKRGPAIPESYNDQELSGLRTTIHFGSNKYNIDLK
jgi:hypothetical protein